MPTEPTPLEVIVHGGSIEANATVYGIVQNALFDAGFTDVTATSPHGDTDAKIEEVPSMLEVLRNMRPALFDTPVMVKQVAPAADILSLTDNDTDTLGIGRVIYRVDPGISCVPEAAAETQHTGDDFREPVVEADL